MKTSNLSKIAPRDPRLLFDGSTNPYEETESTDVFRGYYPPSRVLVPHNGASNFANARMSAKQPIVRQQAREWFPGIFTFSNDHIQFLRNFSAELEHLQPQFDDLGLSLNGLHANFNSIRCVAGYPQQPVSALPRDNSQAREDLGLQKEMQPWQREIAKAVLRRAFSGLVLRAIRIPKMSTTGAVQNVSDEWYKLHYGLHVFGAERYHKYLDCFMRGNAYQFGIDWDAAIIFGTNVRWQVDQPGKKREYWDTRDVLRERSPHKRPINTKVVIDGVELDDFSAMRTRLINQGGWTVNIMLQPFASGFMHHLFEKYPATWYPDETNLEGVLNGKRIWAGDVSQYDHSISSEQIDLQHDIMGEFVEERVVRLSRQLYYAAYFTRPIGDPKDGFRPALVGDPDAYLEDQVSAGNRSGHAFTSLTAKLWKVIDTLCKLNRIGIDVMTHMDEILEGKFHCGILNNGDDEVIWFDDDRVFESFRRYVDNIPKDEKMFEVVFEQGGVYSGKVLQLVGDRQYKPVERITSTFERMVVPERSIGGRMRPYWPIGMVERYNSRSDHDIKEEAFRIFDHCYDRHLSRNYGPFLRVLETHMKQLPINGSGLSAIDQAVLDDPSKIHYKYKPEDVSDDILAISFSKLQPEFFEKYVTSHYNGTIH